MWQMCQEMSEILYHMLLLPPLKLLELCVFASKNDHIIPYLMSLLDVSMIPPVNFPHPDISTYRQIYINLKSCGAGLATECAGQIELTKLFIIFIQLNLLVKAHYLAIRNLKFLKSIKIQIIIKICSLINKFLLT